MTLKACILAEQAVPRYTSYPTAPHFSAEIGPEIYAGWLSALSPDATLSLYLHVPYCAKLCLYCGCHTKIVQRRDPVESYADALAQEIARVAALAGRHKVTSIHWGGGTPSMLGATRLAGLAGQIATAFDLSDVPEHAIEIDPRQCDGEFVGALAAVGVNRASLGVQEFSPLQHTIGLASTLKPNRIALFGYAHVPWFKTHQRMLDATALPGASERLAQAESARKMLISLGYVSIGFDHFARPDDNLAKAAAAGRLHRNFQGYTTDNADALIAFGASAIGRLPQGCVQNASDIAGYKRAIEAGHLATAKGKALSIDDSLRARIIERLMCDFTVDLDAFSENQDFADAFAALAPLAHEHLVIVDGRRIAVTEAGRPFVRLVASAFDAYLARGTARHSRAV